MKKITDKIKKEIVQLRSEGLSYPKIGKRVDLSVTSVSKVVKGHRIKDESIVTTIMKPCPNPRIITIYFGEKENNAKCVVRTGLNYPSGKEILVKPVETGM